MGWYGDTTKCPNCNNENAVESFRSSMLEELYLACPDCGLCLYCEYRHWVVTSSYIDKSIIGNDSDKLQPDEFIDINKNDNIINKDSVL